MSVINTNTLSLVTQNNLTKSQGALNSAIERLSSGMRINSAKDDAAGQAIANRFTASIKGLTQASRNANDGISLAQTTEGALNEVNTNLQRIRELTVQASNGSNSSSDLQSIQGEINQRMLEIDRTSEQTDFNGVKVLAKGTTDLSIQIGAADNQVIKIGLTEISSSTLKLTGFQVTNQTEMANVTTANAGAAFTANITTAADTNTGGGTAATAAGVFALKDGSGYVVKSGTNYYAATLNPAGVASWDASATVSTAKADTLVNVAGGALTTGKQTVTLVPVTGTAYKAVLDKGVSTGEYLTFKSLTGKYAKVDSIATSGAVTEGAEAAVTTAVKTVDPLKALDAALAKVDALRGNLGAVQNRFDSVIANLGSTIVNMSASRSRIEDADYATEVSSMTRAQILQQAGTSVLAKANQSTEGVMSLLR